MKRILYILLILGLNFLNAASLSSTKSVYKVGEDIVIKVKDLEYHPKNWIAIYPKGKSSSGSNVIRWKWTKETTDGEFRFQTVGKVITKPYLPEGEYEARVMYKNSYTPEAVVAFSVKGSDNETPEGTAKLMSSKDVYKLGEDIVIKVRDLEYHPKNWIAIYPKGKSSAGSNVIRWKWTKETTTGEFRFVTVGKVISKPYLPVGEYEARVMYNNSYTPEAIVGFSVKEKVPPQHQGKVSIKSQKAQYIIPEVVKIDVITMDSLDKRVLKVYRENENGKWIEVNKLWGISDKTERTISIEFLPIGKYEARAYYGNELLTKTNFSINSIKTVNIIDKVRQYCKFKERNDNTIICPNEYDKWAYAIHYKNYIFTHSNDDIISLNDRILLYDFVAINLDDNSAKINKKDQKLAKHDPVESVSLERLKSTPIYMYKRASIHVDREHSWSFQYQGKEILLFESYDYERELYNIHTTNKGKNLVLSYNNGSFEPHGILTDTYDISDPTVAKLINREIKPLK